MFSLEYIENNNDFCTTCCNNFAYLNLCQFCATTHYEQFGESKTTLCYIFGTFFLVFDILLYIFSLFTWPIVLLILSMIFALRHRMVGHFGRLNYSDDNHSDASKRGYHFGIFSCNNEVDSKITVHDPKSLSVELKTIPMNHEISQSYCCCCWYHRYSTFV
jgi:hypothetical protein